MRILCDWPLVNLSTGAPFPRSIQHWGGVEYKASGDITVWGKILSNFLRVIVSRVHLPQAGKELPRCLQEIESLGNFILGFTSYFRVACGSRKEPKQCFFFTGIWPPFGHKSLWWRQVCQQDHALLTKRALYFFHKEIWGYPRRIGAWRISAGIL